MYYHVLHVFIALTTCVLQERVLSTVTPSNFSCNATFYLTNISQCLKLLIFLKLRWNSLIL